MSRTNAYRSAFFAVLAATPLLFGCQRMVEKEKMEAVGNWAIQMCKCSEKEDAGEAKSCAAALTQPQLELLNSSGRPIYKLDSVHVYTDIEARGEECQMKIGARQLGNPSTP